MPRETLRAAALHYERGERAPRIVARGEGFLAERILAAAREHGVPIHEDRALVQVLTKLDVDTEIPLEIYQAVAEVLAFLYRANAGARPLVG
jgi:flagellar biosynthesis protein